MGYGIVGGYSKKEMYENDNIKINIQCQYAYQQYFREAFGCEITEWNGRLCKKDVNKFIKGIDNFINILKSGINVRMYPGYLGNINPNKFIEELQKLKALVNNRQIRYLSIS